MTTVCPGILRTGHIAAGLAGCALALTMPQAPAQPTPAAAEDREDLQEQLETLQQRLEQLEAALEQRRPKSTGTSESAAADLNGGGMMKDRRMRNRPRKGMRMMKKKMMMGEQSETQGDGMSNGTMGRMKMGPMMMGRMKKAGTTGARSDSFDSSLPGFPGASHIYHVGSTGFFLDHTEHITLTSDQQKQLNRIREETLLSQATFDRWIDEAEQQLWVLTSSDRPDAAEIRTRVMEIAKLEAEKRLAFIEAVGRAAGVLTENQRNILTGLHSAEQTSVSEDPDSPGTAP